MGGGQYHFDPTTYLAMMRAELPRYDELQEVTVDATGGLEVGRVLELGTGTGETTRRLLDAHPGAELVGVDRSEKMLAVAREAFGGDPRVELRVGRLEEPLPPGPFDLVVSVLTVHHLTGAGKRDLFRRVAGALRPGGRFVLADVVVPERAEDAVTPLSADFDLPDRTADLLEWLEAAGFATEPVWAWKDLAVLRAEAGT